MSERRLLGYNMGLSAVSCSFWADAPLLGTYHEQRWDRSYETLCLRDAGEPAGMFESAFTVVMTAVQKKARHRFTL